MNLEIDTTIRFTYDGNHIARCVDTEANCLIIKDGAPKSKIMEKLFPEFRIFDGWDEDVIATERVILLEVDKISKEGFCLLYKDGSIVIVTEYNGEVVLRYIGSFSMMGYRLDNLHAVKPGVDNWFTTL